MKKAEKSGELLWFLGIIFVALGVAICNKADLGVSMIAAPAFIIYEAVAPLWSGFSVGMIEYFLQGVILALLCITVRKFNWRYLLAFGAAVLYGYVLDLFLLIIGTDVFTEIALRWVMLIIGDVITGFGVACFLRTYMPLPVHELFVSEFSTVFKFNTIKVKRIFDFSLLLLSLILSVVLFFDVTEFDWTTIWYQSFHSIGLGTLVTTIINSFVIALSRKLVDLIFGTKALFPKLEGLLKRN